MEEIKHERKGSCAATPKRPSFNRAQQQQQLPSCYGGGTRRHTLHGPAGHADLRSVTAHHLLLTHPRPEPLSFPREKRTPHPCLKSHFSVAVCRRAKARRRWQRYLSALGRSTADAAGART